MKADNLGVDMVRTACHEPACKGAAILAAVAAAWFDGLKEAGKAWTRSDRAFLTIIIIPCSLPAWNDCLEKDVTQRHTE